MEAAFLCPVTGKRPLPSATKCQNLRDVIIDLVSGRGRRCNQGGWTTCQAVDRMSSPCEHAALDFLTSAIPVSVPIYLDPVSLTLTPPSLPSSPVPPQPPMLLCCILFLQVVLPLPAPLPETDTDAWQGMSDFPDGRIGPFSSTRCTAPCGGIVLLPDGRIANPGSKSGWHTATQDKTRRG